MLNETNAVYDTIVVGAGISGLLAAKQLREKGASVLVVDKGRGVGGRMSTRLIDGGKIDHGAQFFTARSSRFQALVTEWIEAGVAKEWCRGFRAEDGHPRYCGTTGMHDIPRHLAQGLDVEVGWRVSSLAMVTSDVSQAVPDIWLVTSATGEERRARSLILTPPMPQTLALLAQSGISLPAGQQALLEGIAYHPCFAVFGFLADAPSIPSPGALQAPTDAIGWLADNRQKGITPMREAVTIHTTSAYARERLDDDRAAIAADVIASASDWIKAGAELTIHRWLYSQPVKEAPIPEQTHLLAGLPLPLCFAGDGLSAPRVEGAALSGLEAADAVWQELHR